MPVNGFTDKLMIFNKYSNLICDFKSILLADILDPVDKLPCDTFITENFRYSYIQSNSQFAIIGHLPAWNIFRNYLNIFHCERYLMSVNCEIIISIVFKSYNLFWREGSNSVADLLHQFAIPRTKCFEIWFYFPDKDGGRVINIFNFFNINLGKYQIFNSFKFFPEIFVGNRNHNPGQWLTDFYAYFSS